MQVHLFWAEFEQVFDQIGLRFLEYTRTQTCERIGVEYQCIKLNIRFLPISMFTYLHCKYICIYLNMKKFRIYFIGLLLTFSACSDNSNIVLKAYSTYGYSGYLDSSGKSLVIDSKNFDESQVTWNGDIMNFRGSSEDISITLQYNTSNNIISDFRFESFFTDGIVYYDNVSAVNYIGEKGGSHELDLSFDQFFGLATTTNTTTSTITFPNSITLVISE